MSNIKLLTDEDEKILQPKHMKIELMNHQKTIVKRMLDVEDSGEINLDEQNNNFNFYWKNLYGNNGLINTNIAILGDKVGAGKTNEIISMISVRPKLKLRPTELSGDIHISLKIMNEIKINTDITLIIVPSKIIPQWKASFEQASNIVLLTLILKTDITRLIKTSDVVKKNFKNENVIQQESVLDLEILKKNNINVILIGNTMFKYFSYSINNVFWNRIIIDEADTIKLSKNISNVYFNFLWLITATFNGLKYKSLIKNILGNSKNNLLLSLIIKNHDDYVDSSIKLPNPKRLVIKCLTPNQFLELVGQAQKLHNAGIFSTLDDSLMAILFILDK